MNKEVRTSLAVLTTLLSLCLMIGGIIAHKSGATVVGLCVAAASAQQWIVRKQAGAIEENHQA
jgi:hypothetical protein